MIENIEPMTNLDAKLNMLCWYNKNERGQDNKHRNLGVAQMISDATCTNFNMQHINYDETCFEIDIHVACKNFSTSHTHDDTIYIKIIM